MTGQDLAVVIVNYNTANLLADCLTSLGSGGLAVDDAPAS